MAWTQQDLQRDLPRILRLPGIESARVENGSVWFVTKAWTLRHRLSVIPLPRLKVVVSEDSSVFTKYLLGILRMFHWHPTIDLKIGLHIYRKLCVGYYRNELQEAAKSGPYMMVLATLIMLQGIKAEDDEDMWVPWAIWGIIFFTLFLVSPLIALLIGLR